MGLFNKAQNTQALTERQMLEGKYNAARHNILLVVIFTAINVIMLVANANSYFLFSAFVPYYLVSTGMYLCGRYPMEVYSDIPEEELFFLDNSFFIMTVMIAVVIIALYLLSWIFSSKQRIGWIIFALVFFTIDTLGMFALTGFALDSVMDLLFHVWVLYYLVNAIITYNKLKKLPEDEPEAPVAQEVTFNGESLDEDQQN